MRNPESSCLFDLLDAAMRDPFLQQAFRQLDQRHLYGIVPRVCRSWHHLSTTSTISMTVKISTKSKVGTGEPDDATSFSEWLQHNVAKITSLDLCLEGPSDTPREPIGTALMKPYNPADYSMPATLVDMLHTISSATQLCGLQFRLKSDDRGRVPESFRGFAALTNLSSLVIHRCSLCLPAFSSISMLTQLRALDLTGVYLCGSEEEEEPWSELISSLGNLTHLTLGWNRKLVDCVPSLRSLTALVELDITKTFIYSSSIQLLQGLPITGIWICLTHPEHVLDVAGWLERCIPTTLVCLKIEISLPRCELQPSQVPLLLAPLRSAGPQLQWIHLRNLCLSQADVSIITGLTQLIGLNLLCKFDDGGWALLKQAFGHLGKIRRKRVNNMSWPNMSRFQAGPVGLRLLNWNRL